MKLLFLAHRLPCPPDRGVKLRVHTLLRYLARRHEVWCAGFVDALPYGPQGAAVRRSLRELNRACRVVEALPLRRTRAAGRALTSLVRGRTATEGYFASHRLQERVMEWAREVRFDAVLAFSSSMAPLALRVPADRHVLDMDDLDSHKWAESAEASRWPWRWFYATEARRLADREREWIHAFDATVLISQREAALLTDDALRRRTHILEGVTHPEFEFQPHLAGEREWTLPEDPIVGFLGAMDYGPNIDAACWFYQKIWPLIQGRRSDAQWWIVGRSPSRTIRRLDDGRAVRVTGTVPAVGPYLHRMRVNIAPLRLARGVQIKVLTAMARGVPCVVTPCVAEGIGGRNGENYLVAASESEFARAVLSLLNDRSWAEAVGRSGAELVARRFQPGPGLRLVERLLGYEETKAASAAVMESAEEAELYDTTEHEECAADRENAAMGGCL